MTAPHVPGPIAPEFRALAHVGLVEYRYWAVCEVLVGSPIGEVAARYGTSRQSVHAWRARFRQEGLSGLADRSRRPHYSLNRVAAEVEALICDLRRQHPRWGARRISYELARRDVDSAPSRATVHRVLSRNGLVNPQAQQHKRVYRHWQRQAPMHLWQLDLVGGVPLADGWECKMVTGIDDHSRSWSLARWSRFHLVGRCARRSPRRCAGMGCPRRCSRIMARSSPVGIIARSRSSGFAASRLNSLHGEASQPDEVERRSTRLSADSRLNRAQINLSLRRRSGFKDA